MACANWRAMASMAAQTCRLRYRGMGAWLAALLVATTTNESLVEVSPS
jgi:hypothetical protein